VSAVVGDCRGAAAKPGKSGSLMSKLWMGMLLMALSLHAAFAADALEIGIWPYMSTQALLTTYHPLQVYLEQRLHRPVFFVTAPDQKTFVERTQKGQYRFALTAPHFARFAQLDAGYVPMLRGKSNGVGLLLVDKNSTLHDIEDLRGKVITLPDRITSTAMVALLALRDHGLEPERDITVHYSISHNSAVLSVLRGESAAAATTGNILGQMPDNIKNAVKILAKTRETMSAVFIANRDVPVPEVAELTGILLDFVERTPEGVKFIKDRGYQGLRRPTETEMQALDPYVIELKKSLAEVP
jgi:phosphonate transport system substrate-binding protein